MPPQRRNREAEPSGLFGIEHSNRTANQHWGKNCFNSSFPASIAIYMLVHDIPAIYNRLAVVDGELKVVASEIPIREAFNCGPRAPADLDFHFESRFEPYAAYSLDTFDGIDLVVKSTAGEYLRPLEVKLTVLPTSGTARMAENRWGCEMVVRSATTSYCALGMFDGIRANAVSVHDIFDPTCAAVESWTSDYELSRTTAALSQCLNTFERLYLDRQKPLVMQTIWKTRGQASELAENAFDIVFWSDYAFSRLFIDSALSVEPRMSRPMRASARLARCLWELSRANPHQIHLVNIYRQMAFGRQTDKEFAINGQRWRTYVNSPRIDTPRLQKTVVNEIIAPGYMERLRPERRFDQTLYFTAR